jgi:glycosyltransferase involved in cell wall biosynthesis
MALDDLRALASEAEILTLNQDELVRLGNGGVRAGYLPLGVEEVALSPRTASSHAGARVLGTFGFIRAHKGLLPLIEAAGHLAARAPGLTLRAYTSLYPSEDSHRYHRQCLELIERRGLAGTVQLVTEYLPIDDLRRNLHACDLVVLPYDPSDEGASAAAATAIAAKVPLAVSTSSIFDEIRDVAHTLESCEPRAMATELEGLLGNQGRLERLATLAKGYVRQASWRSVAERYLGRYLPGEVR